MTPTAVEMLTATMPTLMDTRAAYTTRENTSRPRLSVPRRVPLSAGDLFFSTRPASSVREV